MTAFSILAKPLPGLRPLPLALSAAAFFSTPVLAQGQEQTAASVPSALNTGLIGNPYFVAKSKSRET